jgi:5-methylcytosine-specific restriction endonuclease McrBC regulatory subunit McrC
MPENPLLKKRAIRKMRQTAMVKPDGTRESHKMEYVGDTSKRRGEFGVYPSVTPKPGKEKSTNPKDWTTQDASQANKKGELIEVKSRRRAERLAAGSWKKGQDRKDAMKEYRQNKKAEVTKKVTSKVKSVKAKVSKVVSKIKPKKTTKVVSRGVTPKAPTNLMAANGRRAVN